MLFIIIILAVISIIKELFSATRKVLWRGLKVEAVAKSASGPMLLHEQTITLAICKYCAWDSKVYSCLKFKTKYKPSCERWVNYTCW